MAYGLGPEGSELPFSQVLADNDEAHLAGFLLFILYFLFVSFLNGIGLGPEGSELPFSQVLADNDEAHLAGFLLFILYFLFVSFFFFFGLFGMASDWDRKALSFPFPKC